MDSLDDFLVEPRQRTAVELLVDHPVLLDGAQLGRGLRADDLEGRHELRIGHLVRGPEAVPQLAPRTPPAANLLREAPQSDRLRPHDAPARPSRPPLTT